MAINGRVSSESPVLEVTAGLSREQKANFAVVPMEDYQVRVTTIILIGMLCVFTHNRKCFRNWILFSLA